MNEVIFLVEPDSEGGYTAQALGHSIFTEADTWDELVLAVQDAVRCHFEEDERLPLLTAGLTFWAKVIQYVLS